MATEAKKTEQEKPTTMRKAYKFRIYPNVEQAELIRKTFGCCRLVWNEMLLACKLTAHESNENRIEPDTKYVRLLKCAMHDSKTGELFLYEVDSSALNYEIRHLKQAYANAFRRLKAGQAPGWPKFKKRGHGGSYTTQNNIPKPKKNGEPGTSQIEVLRSSGSKKRGHIKLPKLGLVKAIIHRDIEGRIVSATIRETPSGEFYCSLGCEIPSEKPTMKTKFSHPVGIDVGLIDFATLSDGERIPNPKYLSDSLQELRKAQRELSRKTKGTKRYERARKKVARLHEHVANQRRHHHHCASAKIIKEHDMVAVEDLNIQGMTKNKRLSRAIADAAWYEFFRQLEYKGEWSGIPVKKCHRFAPSSKLCDCGYVNHGLTLNDREWVCPECGQVHDRDVHAAQNILKFVLEQEVQ